MRRSASSSRRSESRPSRPSGDRRDLPVNTISPLAGQPAAASALVDVAALVSAYSDQRPEPSVPGQRVVFGTSGHRGSSFDSTFNEWHICAIAQAICEYRAAHQIDGPLFAGADTHALSRPALVTAVEVFAANGVHVVLSAGDEFTPTPAVSHAILVHNRGRTAGLADGIVVTPSHNPPRDGGFKYNPPSGGPADPAITRWIENKANEYLSRKVRDVKRLSTAEAFRSPTVHRRDYLDAYTLDISQVIDVDAIRGAKLSLGVDPLGGAGVHYWHRIAERHGLDLVSVNDAGRSDVQLHDARLGRANQDGPLISIRDAPADRYPAAVRPRVRVRHGSRSPRDCHEGRTAAAESVPLSCDRLSLLAPSPLAPGRRCREDRREQRDDRSGDTEGSAPAFETPVGFKWFVDGLLDGSLGLAGEESAGASCLRLDGTAWSTDKDGIVLALLAAEMTARMGRDPAEIYRGLTREFGDPQYERIEAPVTPERQSRAAAPVARRRSARRNSQASRSRRSSLARRATTPDLGGVKVVAQNGWFAARPSGTESIYKIYAESFLGVDHLRRIQSEATVIVDAALGANPKPQSLLPNLYPPTSNL